MSRPFAPARVNVAVTARFASRRPVERDAVAAGAMPQPLRDAGHGGGRGRDTLGDLEVRHASLEQARGLPAVRERLELGQRAEIAQEAAHLVARPQREDRVGEVVEPGELLDVTIERLASAIMLA